MKISILIPAHNEEKSVAACLNSCLGQTRPFDEIVVVNDASTDKTGKILAGFKDKIKVITSEVARGNKSYAQELGLPHITGDVFVSTDADTVLDKDFVKNIEADFKNPKVAAVGGYVRSLKYNWLTACRAYDYAIGQKIHKQAQSNLEFMLVIPGAAGAFRTEIFRKYLHFDHDTVTEDLDFTYKLHKNSLKIAYNPRAIVYTQDPVNLKSYISQMRRWYGGGWQNLRKHFSLKFISDPRRALELSLVYVEGMVFSSLLFILPFLDIFLAVKVALLFMGISFLQAIYAAVVERRADLLFVPVFYFPLSYINSAIFIEQFFKAGILTSKKMNFSWVSPDRVRI